MTRTLLFCLMFLFSLNSIAATYEVPGSEDVPPYQMEFKLKKKKNLYFTDYKLPLDLTGAENRIRAQGSFDQNGVLVLAGKNGKLSCQFTTRQCHAVYEDIVVDEDLVRFRLQEKGLSEEEIKPFLAATRRFGGDPIGVIHFSLDQRSRAQKSAADY